MFHNLLAHRPAAATPCASQGPGYCCRQRAPFSNLKNPSKQLLWRTVLNAGWIFFFSLSTWGGNWLRDSWLQREGRLGLDCSPAWQSGVFWFSLKFLGCLSRLLHWLWLGCSCVCCSLSSTPVKYQWPQEERQSKVGNSLAEGFCSGFIVDEDH